MTRSVCSVVFQPRVLLLQEVEGINLASISGSDEKMYRSNPVRQLPLLVFFTIFCLHLT